jgi:DNA polymerase-1
MSKTLILDLHNFAHRCRAGMSNDGDNFLFKFIRNLRALVATHKPNAMVFVKEGSPKHRYELFKEYKQNRKVKEDDPNLKEKWAELMGFREKINEAADFALKDLEVTVMRHGALEADDVIANYARFLAGKGEEVVVASNDKDFVQLLYGAPPNIKVYDIGKKEFMATPDHDPVVYKAIAGDKSDNIPGVEGYGPKKASKCAQDLSLIEQWGEENRAVYERNLKLVRFYEMTDDDWRHTQIQRGRWDPAALMIDFMSFEFTSLVEQKTLEKFYETFGNMKMATLP